MLFSIAIYVFLLLVTIPTLYLSAECGRNAYLLPLSDKLYYSPVILLSLVLGFRYDVGVDYLSYKHSYESSFISNPWEFLWNYVSTFLSENHYPYYLFCFLVSFFSYLYLFKSCKRFDSVFIYIFVFLFLSGHLFLSLNIQRQALAFFILLYSIKFIAEKELLKFIFFTLIATGIHFSSCLYLPLYILCLFRFNINKYIMLLLFLTSFVFSEQIRLTIYNTILDLAAYTASYGRYGDAIILHENTVGSGIGIIMKFISSVLVILYSDKLSEYFSKYRLDIYLKIFFIGIIILNVAGNSLLLSRVAFLFEGTRFVILGFLTYYLVESRTVISRVLCNILFISYFAYFIGMILYSNNKCSPFNFVHI